MDNDEKIRHLEKLIDNKKHTLLLKQQSIKSTLHDNVFLRGILGNLHNFNEQLIHEKQKQKKALQMLHDYIQKLNLTEKLSNGNAIDAKAEQAKILKEIKKINDDLKGVSDDLNEF
jgi:hypothetical protein|tara:strand:+ start:467 stop:814 length:348 start_codon:yes stop_codon:yes gene_type:complete